MAFVAVLVVAQYLMVGLYAEWICLFLIGGQWLFQILQNIKSGHICSWKWSVMAVVSASNLFYFQIQIVEALCLCLIVSGERVV